MYLAYSILLSLGFTLMLPLFLLRREKYASGFRQRLGNYPEFKHDGRKLIWLHCVSVGETNAARPLVEALRKELPNYRLLISTTTKTGQELAQKIFADAADAIVYFPFDFKFSVRRALAHFKPELVLLMETEIWPRFIREAKRTNAKVAIVNGRLSERSFSRYSRIRSFVRKVLSEIDAAVMQGEKDAERIIDLGIDKKKVTVTGNIKLEQISSGGDDELTRQLRSRFGIATDKPLIIAASTHEPEERRVIESLDGILGHRCRLLIAPRHPERFSAVADLLFKYPYKFVRRSASPSDSDKEADIILLDSIGELRAAYPLAEIVFVGGSLIPHGGQSIIEPAAEGKAIVTGPYTHNFEAIVEDFREGEALRQLPRAPDDSQVSERLYEEFIDLLDHAEKRVGLGSRAASLINSSNANASRTTVDVVHGLLNK